MKKKYYRPDEAAWLLEVSKRTIYRLILSGEIIAFSIRRRGAVRIPAESLEAYIERRIEDYQSENGIFVSGDDNR